MFLFHRDANDLYQVEKITLEVVVLSFISNLALPPYYVFYYITSL